MKHAFSQGKIFGDFHELARASAHGISGGAVAEMQGGKFGAGFFSSFASSLAFHSSPMSKISNPFLKVVAAGTVGGTASVIGGGRFENGAVTSAFQSMFNGLIHEAQEEKSAEIIEYLQQLSPEDRAAFEEILVLSNNPDTDGLYREHAFALLEGRLPVPGRVGDGVPTIAKNSNGEYFISSAGSRGSAKSVSFDGLTVDRGQAVGYLVHSHTANIGPTWMSDYPVSWGGHFRGAGSIVLTPSTVYVIQPGAGQGDYQTFNTEDFLKALK